MIELVSDILQYQGVKLQNPHHVTIPQGVTIVIGPNGAGKSTLGRIIEKGWNICTNKLRCESGKLKIRSIEFYDIHSLAGFSTAYYQQRYESMMNDDVPTVGQIMCDRMDNERWKQLCSKLRLNDIEEKRINYLSSGELRKLLIVNLLMDLPDVIILDNPYIGLDSASRKLLDDTIAEIASRGVDVIMLLCNTVDIPQYTTTVIPIDNLVIGRAVSRRGEIGNIRQSMTHLFDYAIDIDSLPHRDKTLPGDVDIVMNLNKCSVKYGNRTILDEIDWTVRAGECWALAGPNGSGKSTLLSLVYADNPQGYNNDITLFDRRRGTGETIWDIKSRIGYISPEMHLYFNTMSDVQSMVAQGLNNTIGDFRRLTPQQLAEAMRWLRILHIEHLADRRFNTLSTGEQRLALLARTFIKQPELLILDEPLHGLDMARKRSVRAIINHMTARDGLTLVYVTHYLPEVPECVTRTKTLVGAVNMRGE